MGINEKIKLHNELMAQQTDKETNQICNCAECRTHIFGVKGMLCKYCYEELKNE